MGTTEAPEELEDDPASGIDQAALRFKRSSLEARRAQWWRNGKLLIGMGFALIPCLWLLFGALVGHLGSGTLRQGR